MRGSERTAIEPSPGPIRFRSSLLLLSGNRFCRPLAGARVGMGALAAHRQTAAVTQAAIAPKVHEPLDVDAGFAAKVALHDIVAVDHFADLYHFLVAQLADATRLGDLDLFNNVGRDFRTDAMDILKRDQDALVGRDVDAGNTGHGIFSPVAGPSLERGGFLRFTLSRADVRKHEHDA